MEPKDQPVQKPWGLTEEELKILETPEEELERQGHVFCFSLKEFYERIKGGERWQQVMIAHLYLEHVTEQMLSEALVNPKSFNISRMSFSSRVELAFAMGLLPNDVKGPLNKITKIRNAVAHRLNFEVTDQSVKDLESCISVEARQQFIEIRSGKAEFALNDLLVLVLVICEISRQQNAASRLLRHKSKLKLQKALEDLKKLGVG